MRQSSGAILLTFIALIFVLSVLLMQMGAVHGLQGEFTLFSVFSLFLFGPISILTLAAGAACIRSVDRLVDYQRAKPFIVMLAVIQLVSMATYLVLIWRGR